MLVIAIHGLRGQQDDLLAFGLVILIFIRTPLAKCDVQNVACGR